MATVYQSSGVGVPKKRMCEAEPGLQKLLAVVRLGTLRRTWEGPSQLINITALQHRTQTCLKITFLMTAMLC